MIDALFHYAFLQHAVFAGILASIVCGLIGSLILEKKLLLLSGGIAHTSYGGVGLGYLMGFPPILGAFLFSVAAALGIGFIRKRDGAKADVLIALFWSLGMAAGILFVSLMPGYPPDLSSYLFGSILSVTKADLWLMLGLTIFVSFVILALYHDWKAYLFDREFAFLRGVRTGFLDYLLLVLIAMTAVALIRVVGIILILALLAAPAATAALFSRQLKRRMLLSVLLGNLFCFVGLWLSYSFEIASGAAIVILSTLSYFAVYALKAICSNFRSLSRSRARSQFHSNSN